MKSENSFFRVILVLCGGLLLGVLLFAGAAVLYENASAGKVFRGVSVADVVIGGLSESEAADKLAREIRFPFETAFSFSYEDRTWQALPQELGFSPQTEEMIRQAMQVGRSGSFIGNLSERLGALLHGHDIDPIFLFDERVAFNFISRIAEEIDTPMEQPAIQLQGSEVVIIPGKSGLSVNRAMAMSMLQIYGQHLQSAAIDLPVTVLEPSAANLGEQEQILEHLLSSDFILYTNDERGLQQAGSIPADVLAGMINFEPVITEQTVSIAMTPKQEPFYTRLIEIGNNVYREARNARFTYNESTRQLQLLSEAVTGKEIDIEKTFENISASLRDGQNQAEVALVVKEPELWGTESAEELGISGLVHTENTYFFYSDDARIKNIQIGAGKLNGQMIAPGATFSMADAIGEVSAETGFAESSVIFGSETIQDVGGGLCQVSTTLFRAAFHYGLEINERHAHGYRVYYYERLGDRTLDPGLAGMDAAVYLPTLDLKFTNDTPYWILMETDADPGLCRLQWRFYSTDVDRYVESSSTGLTNVIPEGEPVYRLNPELPTGVIDQVDWGIDGADVTITRTVWENGGIHIQDKFETHYEAWSDIYEYGPGTQGIPDTEGE